MPSWWTGNSRIVITTQHEQHKHEKKKKKRNKKEIYRDKSMSYDEQILLTHSSSRSSHDSKSSSVSSNGSPIFSGFDSDVPSEVVEKKTYPLPTPTSLSSEPSVKYNRELAPFGSETVLRSRTNSPVSSSSTSSNNDGVVDAVVHDHGDFGYFRQVEETKCRNSWKRTSSPGSKALTIHRSSLPAIWDAGFESPPKDQENSRHPCHPLPPPPISPTKSSQTLLSNWKKGKLIGRGTFGHVYAGFNSENGQMCAMKEVRVISDDQNSNECLKQLNQEIALLSELSHPNIVQYYGSKLGEDNLSVYLEYVSGGSIHKLLTDYGPFSEPLIQNYTKQILSGLAYLHGRKTVHRDIKGANILVGPNGEIKLADFGMARNMTTCSWMRSFRGSAYWMAPEVIENASGYNLAVDVWSLGCTVLEMATSKPPWSQYDGVAAIFKIAHSKDYPEIPSYLSEDAQSFVKLCLQRDPSVRPTAAQLLHHPFIQNQEQEKNC